MATVREILTASGLPGLEARMLLQHVLQVPRAWLIAHDTDTVPPAAQARFDDLAAGRTLGRPMAYLLGTREFMGHCFQVSPAVLIPRPETELLVETALDDLNRRVAARVHGPRSERPRFRRGQAADAPEPDASALRVLDLGTGSGAIAISVALACPHADIVATDISAQALDLARHNARRLAARVEFLPGSWYHALSDAVSAGLSGSLAERRDFDVIVSNPPYIAAGDRHLTQGDLRFEPAGALTDGADGLLALRAIVRGAAPWLAPGGSLWLEHGWDQAAAVRALLRQSGFRQIRSLPDLAGIERVSGGLRHE